MLRTLKLSHILAMIPVFIVALAVLSSDAQSNFRESFIENYNTNNFNKQKFLVMKRKAEVPAEIDLFIKDAMATENVAGRMYYLDMANTLATMHMHWNDGPKELLTKIEKLQKVELDKRNAQKELQKIRDAAEDTPGNFIMETNKAAIDKAGVAPVIYPHWVHRSFFRCKTCHTGLFEMKLGANEINHKNMAEGTLCGACHDGSYSFASNKNDSECIRCHNFGKEESTPIIDLSYYDAKKFEEIAERVGSVWNTKNLPDGELPLDRLKFINWVTLDKLSAFTPLDSFNGTEGTDEGVRISHILFETNSTWLKDVVFSHETHTTWINCSLCHDDIFEKKLGSSNVTMISMKEGTSCGTCHGRVSFTYKDCLRCHDQDPKDVPEKILKRK